MSPESFKLDPRLGKRLRKVYRLASSPTTLTEFRDLLRTRFLRDPKIREFIERVRAGKAVIGECRENRGYSLAQPDGHEVQVACAYDALMTAILRGKGRVYAACPHCREQMEIRLDGSRVRHASPRSILFWWGTGPDNAPGHPICDHLHLFPSRRHLAAWLEAQRDELGVVLPLKQATAFLAKRF